MTLKYYSHLDLTYTKDLAVQLLKSVQNECRNLYNRWSEDCCWEDSFLSANTYDRTTQHEESYEREHAKHEGLYKSSLHLCDEWEQLHVSYISKYSYLNISCCNIIFFSRISQLYEQFHLKAAHCSNESELTLKAVSFDSLRFEEKEWNSDLDYNKLLLNWMWTCQTTMSVCSFNTYTVSWKSFKSSHTLNCSSY
jgi:hypothetical protein